MVLHRYVLPLEVAGFVRPLRNAAARGASDDPALTNPTTGIVDCCARAATGHAAAAPPSSVMNSRRFTPTSPVLPNERNSPQGTAALRDFDSVYAADGSNSDIAAMSAA